MVIKHQAGCGIIKGVRLMCTMCIGAVKMKAKASQGRMKKDPGRFLHV